MRAFIWDCLTSKMFMVIAGLASVASFAVSVGSWFFVSIPTPQTAFVILTGMFSILFLIAYALTLNSKRDLVEKTPDAHKIFAILGWTIPKTRDIGTNTHTFWYGVVYLVQNVAHRIIEAGKLVVMGLIIAGVVIFIVWSFSSMGGLENEKSTLIRSNAELKQSVVALPQTIQRKAKLRELDVIRQMLLSATSRDELKELRNRQVVVDAWYKRNISEHKVVSRMLKGIDTDPAKALEALALLWAGETSEAEQTINKVKLATFESRLAGGMIKLAKIAELENQEPLEESRAFAASNMELILDLKRLPENGQSLADQLDAIHHQIIAISLWFTAVTSDGCINEDETLSKKSAAVEYESVRQYLALGRQLLGLRDSLVDKLNERLTPLSERVMIDVVAKNANWAQQAIDGLLRLSGDWSGDIQQLREEIRVADNELKRMIDDYVKIHGPEGVIEYAEQYRHIAMRLYDDGQIAAAKKQLNELVGRLEKAGQLTDLRVHADEWKRIEVCHAAANLNAKLQEIRTFGNRLNNSGAEDLNKWWKTILNNSYHPEFDTFHPLVADALIFLAHRASSVDDTKHSEFLASIIGAMQQEGTVRVEDVSRMEDSWEQYERQLPPDTTANL